MRTAQLGFLSLLVALFSVLAPATDLPQVIQKAISLKNEVEKANRSDIEYLWDAFQPKFKALSKLRQHRFLLKLRERLKSDKEVLRRMHSVLLGDRTGSPELRTSIVQLIGTGDRYEDSGILDDARALVSREGGDVLYADLESLSFERNQLTVLKTLLIYANVLLAEDENLSKLVEKGIEKKVQLLYSTPCPASIIPPKLLSQLVLGCPGKDGRMFIPNAGFVSGGNFVDGKCRGVDCSAFVSECARARVRMSPLYLDYLWREIKEGEKGFMREELPIRKELLEKYQLRKSKEDFIALDVKDTLKPGDIINWRTRAIKSTYEHTVLYLAPIPGIPNEFVGLEAIREDNKTKEGIEAHTMKLERRGLRTTILRRRD